METQPGRAAASEICANKQVKKENGEEGKAESTDGHLHEIKVKLGESGPEYTIDCKKPSTVLAAIKSELRTEYNKLKCPDQYIEIQLGKMDKECAVATHFPCTCLNGEPLIISCETNEVEKAPDQQNQTIHSEDKYSVFYIDTKGGKNTKTKELFRNDVKCKEFKYLCVYGEKGMTVEEALRRDGRFIDDLGDFTLSDNEKKGIIKCTRLVDILDKKKFKISLPRKMNTKNAKQAGPSSHVVHQTGISVTTAVKERGITVKTTEEQSSSSEHTEEIYEILCQQFPDLKKMMESRFSEGSYQEALNLRKEDFGKIQQSFSEVHRVKKLFKLGKSVCKVIIENVRVGTGFVLFDNFILTNAHLFKDCVEGEQLIEGTKVFVLFNYEEREPHTNYYYFRLAHRNICSDDVLDYAILELNREGHKPNTTTPTKITDISRGLLKDFGPLPSTGEACIIGHPAGGVKKMDPTCIIEKEKRGQAVNEHLDKYKHTLFTLLSISQLIKDQGIDKIMVGEGKDKVTYNTFMYHGSSGSPVFDAQCRVFGLHTAGFTYGFPERESVIEYARSLLIIFEHFVRTLKKRGNKELLEKVKKAARKNQHVKKVLESLFEQKPVEPQEPSDGDSDETMEIEHSDTPDV